MGWGWIGSILTGGASDIVEGNVPGTAIAEAIGGQQVADIFSGVIESAATGGLADAYRGFEGYQDNGDIWTAMDRAVDPGGAVDWGLRETGEYLPDSLREVAPQAGAVVGGIVGSYVPVLGTAAGAAIGRGVGGKLQGQSNKQNMIGSGTTYALTATPGAISNAVSGTGGVVDTGGDYLDIGGNVLPNNMDPSLVQPSGDYLDIGGNIIPPNMTPPTLSLGEAATNSAANYAGDTQGLAGPMTYDNLYNDIKVQCQV